MAQKTPARHWATRPAPSDPAPAFPPCDRLLTPPHVREGPTLPVTRALRLGFLSGKPQSSEPLRLRFRGSTGPLQGVHIAKRTDTEEACFMRKEYRFIEVLGWPKSSFVCWFPIRWLR